MSKAVCPTCHHSLDARHTHMANLPSTAVCAGCGSWLKVDVKSSGSFILSALVVLTLVAAWFVPAVLVLIPVYLVMSTGPFERFSVTAIEKRRAPTFSVVSDEGEDDKTPPVPYVSRPMLADDLLEHGDAGPEKDAVSEKLNRMRPFKVRRPLEEGAAPQTSTRHSKTETATTRVSGRMAGATLRELPH